jgi:hypothetical protein
MAQNLREIVIPKEEAIFWLDKDGRWRNADGRFRHKRIIDHFHASIAKDADGYFVFQQRGDCLEKVYFRYEDTALFVFDVVTEPSIVLILNTKKRIPLIPDRLFLHQDHLYVTDGDDRIKFAETALIKISNLIEENDGQFYIILDNVRYKIYEKS